MNWIQCFSYFLLWYKLYILSNILNTWLYYIIIINNITRNIFNLVSTFILIFSSLCYRFCILSLIRLYIVLWFQCFNCFIYSWLYNNSLSSRLNNMICNNSCWSINSFCNYFWFFHYLFSNNLRRSHYCLVWNMLMIFLWHLMHL